MELAHEANVFAMENGRDCDSSYSSDVWQSDVETVGLPDMRDMLGFSTRWLVLSAFAFFCNIICWTIGSIRLELSSADQFLTTLCILLNAVALLGILLAFNATKSRAFHVMLLDVVAYDNCCDTWLLPSRVMRRWLARLVIVFVVCHWLQVLSNFLAFSPTEWSQASALEMIGSHLGRDWHWQTRGVFWTSVSLHLLCSLGYFLPLASPLLLMRELSKARIEVVLARLERSQEIDWAVMTRSVRRLDEQLGQLWLLSSAGGPWVTLFATKTIYISTCLVFTLIQWSREFGKDPYSILRASPQILAVSESLSILVGLGALASLTTSCSSTKATRRSIANLASAYAEDRHHGSPNCLQYDRFVGYLRRKELGIELGGMVLVSWRLVTAGALWTLVQLPIAYAVVNFLSVMTTRPY